jgi:2-keto-3-deoxy-L-rhamnonate aldolase RhmA
MVRNPVREKLLAGGTSLGVMAHEFFTPGLAGVLAAGGAEFVLIDMEHGGVGIDTVKQQVAFAHAAGIMPFVRVPACERYLVCTVLDAGAMGIMAPMLETAEQAAALVSWCRYRPEGVRGLAFGLAHDRYRPKPIAEAAAAANAAVLTIPLIETVKGLENARAIMATPGIDLGWVGHYDMTDSMGIAGQIDHPRYRAAEVELLAAAEAAGKPFGWLAGNGAEAKAALAKGYRCLSINTDVGLLRNAVTAEFTAANG